ncbi:MAG: hypothetical protein ABJB12_09780 [Pseudomonadota bacterium]
MARAVPLGVLLGALSGCIGCGATGLGWVAESQLPVTAQSSASGSDLRPAPLPSEERVIPATAEQEPAAEARPRLSHTLTLGEITVQSPAVVAASGPPSPSVTINNYYALSAPSAAYGYASFGYRPGAGNFYDRSGPVQPSNGSNAGPQAGQSWPAIADHGPSFPYRSGPAAPWARSH